MKSNCSEKTIRVLHLLTHLEKGGAEKNTFFAMEALKNKGYDVHLGFGESFEESQKRKALKKNIKIQQFDNLKNQYINLWKNVKAIKNIRQYLTSENIDIIHTHQTAASILGRIAAWRAKTPLVIYGIHGSTFSAYSQPKKSLLFLAEYITKLSTDHFVSVGKELRGEFINSHICTNDNSTVIYSPIEFGKFYQASDKKEYLKEKYSERFDFNSNQTLIGTVGRLSESKGYEIIIKVASHIVQDFEDVKFFFVGGDSEGHKKKLQGLIKKENLSQDIIFTGHQENIAEVMCIFDVFLFTSLREGLPQVLVQASACAVPIITFDVNGAKEIVSNGESGYVVPKGDNNELSQKLESLIENQKKAEKMGSRGQEIIDEWRWSPEKMKQETIELYNKLIENHKQK